MASMMKPGIILLKEGSDTSQGIPQIVSNTNACQAVVDCVKTTLGPRGMDKLIIDGRSTTISNDGATIISKLDFVHPAAQIMVDIAQAQDDEIGDGTTSVVILAGELLKKAKTFIEDGVDPRKVASSYHKACQLVVDRIKQLQIDIKIDSPEGLDKILLTCADTTLNSKLVNNYKHIFTPMVVQAVKHLDDYLPLNMIGVKKISGGTMEDSRLILGVAFKKAFSYAGFEMQPKKYVNPKIAILNIELELKAEKENAELRIKSVDEYQKVVDAEWDILYNKLEKLVNCGAKIVLSRLPIGDVATQYFADRDVFCAGRVADEDLKRTIKACGGTIQSVLEQTIKQEYLGSCDLFEEIQIGNERYNIFTGCPLSKTCTFLLRGCGEQYLDEVHRSLHDAIMIVRRTIKKNAIVAGGGAIEMELSKYLRDYSLTIPGKEQLFIGAFAMALEVIPRQLCLNAGLDVPSIMNPLRYQHSLPDGSGVWFGVDLMNENIADNYISAVWEPSISKINSIVAATEAACLILTVDETVSAKSRNH